MLDLAAFDALTFDCYGTLIDWETGIVEALRPVAAAHGSDVTDEALLEGFARYEAALEAGPYRSYREVLAGALRGLASDFGFEPSDDEVAAFSGSVGDWPAFPDSAEALAALKRRFRLGVITNCDDDLFALSNRRLGVEFDWVVTAQQARGYKPDPAELRVCVRAHRRAPRADPARRPEPVPRPRAGQGARHDDRVDRPPPGPQRLRRDAARGGGAGPGGAGHAVVRGAGRCG